MKSNTVRVLAAGVAVMAIGIHMQRSSSGSTIAPKGDSVGAADRDVVPAPASGRKN